VLGAIDPGEVARSEHDVHYRDELLVDLNLVTDFGFGMLVMAMMNVFSLDYLSSFVVHIPDKQLNAFLPSLAYRMPFLTFMMDISAIAFFYFVHHTPNENQLSSLHHKPIDIIELHF
jgi:hypothetical protein